LTLLDRPPVAFCPSVSPKSLALLIQWKRGVKGTPLLDSNDHPVLDVNGIPMVCAEGWQAETITQFQAAVSINHIARGHKGLYEENGSTEEIPIPQ
jgi:hypothetical protein